MLPFYWLSQFFAAASFYAPSIEETEYIMLYKFKFLSSSKSDTFLQYCSFFCFSPSAYITHSALRFKMNIIFNLKWQNCDTVHPHLNPMLFVLEGWHAVSGRCPCHSATSLWTANSEWVYFVYIYYLIWRSFNKIHDSQEVV